MTSKKIIKQARNKPSHPRQASARLDKTPGISIVITTRNRPDKLKECIGSILQSRYPNKEIVVIDQSTNERSKTIIASFPTAPIRYAHVNEKGASNGRNRGVAICKHDIIAFTDDDCLVSPLWLRTIAQSFSRYPDVVAVFGQVLPAQKESVDARTVGINRLTKHTLYTSPPPHHLPALIGNNWSIRKKIFIGLHGFKPWLGPGSVGYGAEEDEMFYRILTSHRAVYANPLLQVRHTHVVTRIQYNLFYTRYGSGFFMLFTYYATGGDRVARQYLQTFIHRQLASFRSEFTQSIRMRSVRYFAYLCFTFCYEILYYIRGALLGLLISIRDVYFRSARSF